MSLKKMIRKGNTCAIYVHSEDISDVLRYIKINSKRTYKIHQNSIYKEKKKRRTISGFFIKIDNTQIKCVDAKDMDKNIPLYVWNKTMCYSKGGDSYGL